MLPAMPWVRQSYVSDPGVLSVVRIHGSPSAYINSLITVKLKLFTVLDNWVWNGGQQRNLMMKINNIIILDS